MLLDTHVALWVLVSPEYLTDRVRGAITNTDNVIFVSAVSVWEIAVKFAIRKRDAPPFSGAEALGHFQDVGFRMLSVTAEHAAGVDRLPPHHRDPFDRLLVSQALVEPLRLVTHDSRLAAYSDTVITF